MAKKTRIFLLRSSHTSFEGQHSLGVLFAQWQRLGGGGGGAHSSHFADGKNKSYYLRIWVFFHPLHQWELSTVYSALSKLYAKKITGKSLGTYDFCIAWVDVLPLSSWASLVAIEAVWIVFRIRIQPEWFACRFLYYYILIFSTKLRKVLNIKCIIHIGVNGEQNNNLSTSYKSSPVWRGVNKLVFNLCLPVCTMEKIKDNGVNKKSTSNIIKKNICVFLQNRTIYGNLSSKRKFYYNNNKQEKEQLEKRLGFSEFKL